MHNKEESNVSNRTINLFVFANNDHLVNFPVVLVAHKKYIADNRCLLSLQIHPEKSNKIVGPWNKKTCHGKLDEFKAWVYTAAYFKVYIETAEIDQVAMYHKINNAWKKRCPHILYAKLPILSNSVSGFIQDFVKQKGFANLLEIQKLGVIIVHLQCIHVRLMKQGHIQF